MATSSNTHSSAGTTFELAQGTPATWDQAGFAAQTFVKIGKIKNGGAFGKQFQIITSEYLSQRGSEKRKGTFNAGALDLQVDVKTDEGQQLCEEALDDDADYTIRVTLQSGKAYFLRGIVAEFTTSVGGPNDMTSANIKIELNPIFLATGEEVASLLSTP